MAWVNVNFFSRRCKSGQFNTTLDIFWLAAHLARYSPAMNAAPHLLIVDDDQETCSVLSKFLAQYGYRISVAANSDAMIQALASAHIDLVVLDIMLPGKDGLSLCRELRARGKPSIINLSDEVLCARWLENPYYHGDHARSRPSGAMPTDDSRLLAESHHQHINLVGRFTKRLGTKCFDRTTSALSAIIGRSPVPPNWPWATGVGHFAKSPGNASLNVPFDIFDVASDHGLQGSGDLWRLAARRAQLWPLSWASAQALPAPEMPGRRMIRRSPLVKGAGSRVRSRRNRERSGGVFVIGDAALCR